MKFTKNFPLAVLLLFSCTAFGAKVTKLIKKRSVAIINIGTTGGVTKGTKVCFFKGRRRVVCGVVRKALGNKSYVKIRSRRYKSLKRGMAARPQGGGSGGGGSSDDFGSVDIKPVYIYSPSAPATYQKLAFSPAESGATQESAWTSTGSASAAVFPSFGLEVNVPVGGIGLGIGFRMRQRKFSSQADYDTTATNFTETVINESANGLWFTAYFAKLDLGAFKMLLGGGLDVDQSSLAVSISQKSDSGDDNSIYSATGSLMTISLSGTAHLTLEVTDGFGLLFGTRLMVPVSGSSTGVDGAEITDAQVTGASTAESPKADFNFALDYKKNSFGLEVHMGFIFIF